MSDKRNAHSRRILLMSLVSNNFTHCTAIIKLTYNPVKANYFLVSSVTVYNQKALIEFEPDAVLLLTLTGLTLTLTYDL